MRDSRNVRRSLSGREIRAYAADSSVISRVFRGFPRDNWPVPAAVLDACAAYAGKVITHQRAEHAFDGIKTTRMPGEARGES